MVDASVGEINSGLSGNNEEVMLLKNLNRVNKTGWQHWRGQGCGGLRVKNPITANWLCRKNQSATPSATVEVFFVRPQWDT